MMKSCYVAFLLLLLLPSGVLGQSDQDSFTTSVDSLYREDQFYLGFTYNILTQMPENVSFSGFSGGFHLGFIRDFPINYKRNLAVGIGLGWSINTYGQTLFIGEEPVTERTIFNSLETLEALGVEYDRNRFTTQSVELPLQFRWRTSTFDSHKFWRIYTGIDLGYVYYFKSNFEQPGNIVRQTDVPEFDRLRMGATFSFGYNTFNFHVYYSLNPFFNDDALLDGEKVDMNTIRVGLRFYIL